MASEREWALETEEKYYRAEELREEKYYQRNSLSMKLYIKPMLQAKPF